MTGMKNSGTQQLSQRIILVLTRFSVSLTEEETVEFEKANKYCKGKGFEHFLFKLPGVAMERSGPQQALSGWPELPDESVLEVLLIKLVAPEL